MSRRTRSGTAEPISRDKILRHVRGQRNIHFPCSADHKQDWEPYPVDPYSAICHDSSITYYIYIQTMVDAPLVPNIAIRTCIVHECTNNLPMLWNLELLLID